MIETIPFPEVRSPSKILPFLPQGLPAIFEDEGMEEMGETADHVDAMFILLNGVRDHLQETRYQVFSNLNLYYDSLRPAAYVSADVMVVEPYRRLESARSYRVGKQGPAPLLTMEVLSPRTAQQGDLTNKPNVYAGIGVAEYILIDMASNYLGQRLQIRKLQPDGSWSIGQDEDGGVTSVLGFRVVFDRMGKIQVFNAETGRPYTRPDRADAETIARHEAEHKAFKAEEMAKLAVEQKREAQEEKRQAEKAKRRAEKEKREAEEKARLSELEKLAAIERIRDLEAMLKKLNSEGDR